MAQGVQRVQFVLLLLNEQQQHELNLLYTLGRVPQQYTASSLG
jgi:hypothetical protein